MSKKTLNRANLAALGADRLADLLMEVSTGSADIKRRLRLELSHNLGSADLAHEVRKRLNSLRRSKSFVSWRKRKALVSDLITQVSMIADKIAPDDPATAFDLLWQFMELAPSLYERTDDRRGDISEVFKLAIQHFATITPHATPSTDTLAERIYAAISENTYGEWDGILALCSPSLGDEGLNHLQVLIENHVNEAIDDPETDHEALQFLRQLRDNKDDCDDRRQRFVKRYLQEIAQIRGDTSAYIAQFTPKDLKRKPVAAEIATLLLADNRPEEALAALTRPEDHSHHFGQESWDDAFIETLKALGRGQEAQEHRWYCFETRLDLQHLLAFLDALPDFEDVEFEDRARKYVLEYPDLSRALKFCLERNDHQTASKLIITRATELDGENFELMNTAADALSEKYPLASILLLRSMIDFALIHGRSSRYAYAIQHLKDCETLDLRISDYGFYKTHAGYVDFLRSKHHQKTSFWRMTTYKDD